MYQGKHHKHSRRNSGKSIALLVSLLLILGAAICGTIAFLMDTDGPLENIFNPSQVTTEVVEDITTEPQKKQNVSIKNTGNTEAWIRAAVIITWQNTDGNVYGQAPAETINYTIDYGTENGWVKGEDGFWYYTSPVPAGNSTDDLINSCTPVGDAPDADYNLNVEIIGSGIQSKPISVFNTVWESSGFTLTDDGTMTIN